MNRHEIDWGNLKNVNFKSKNIRFMLAGILLIIFGLIFCSAVPTKYKNYMVEKHQQEIKITEATVQNIACEKIVNYHRYSPSTHSYSYTIRVYIDGMLHTLEKHKIKSDNPGFEVDDIINVYSYKDRYALEQQELFNPIPITQTVYALTFLFGFALIIYGKYIYKEPEEDNYGYDSYGGYDDF